MLNEIIQFIESTIPFLVYYVSNPYFVSATVILVGLLLSHLLLFILENVLRQITKKTKPIIVERLINENKTPFLNFIILFSIFFAFDYLSKEGIASLIAKLALTGVYYSGMVIINRSVRIFTQEWLRKWAEKTESHLDDALLPIFEKASTLTIYLLGILTILSMWGVEIGPLLAGVGIAGLAIGFAVQDSLKNIFGGISLMLDHTFKIGDKVSLESGETGIIADVGLRSTKIRTFDNELITVPNGILANMKIKNYTQPDPKIRVVVDFSVAYGSDIDKVKKIAMKVLDSIEGKLKEPPPEVVFVEMGDFFLKFSARFWVPHYGDQYAKKLEATRKIYDALVKNNIEIPFPTQTIYLKETEKKKKRK